MPHPPRPNSELRRVLTVLIVFGIVYGYVEAAAVVYIRIMMDPIHHRIFPTSAADDLFPLPSFEQWSHSWRSECGIWPITPG
jgi:hypothetical protein